MDKNIFDSINSGLNTTSKELGVYNTLLGDLSGAYAKAGDEQDKVARKMLEIVNTVKSGQASFLGQVKALKDIRKATEDVAVANKKMELSLKVASFASADFLTQIQKTATGLGKVGEKLEGMSKFLTRNTGLQLGTYSAVTGELVKFNREMFTVSRQAQLLGRNPVISGETWKNLRQQTTLSRTEFVKFSSEMNRQMVGLPMTIDKSVTAIGRFQKAFGQGEWEEQFKRIHVGMQSILPGFGEWIEKAKDMSDATGFKSVAGDVKNVAAAMHTLGADVRQVEAMFMYLNKTLDEQNSSMAFETAVKKRQQAINDMNLKMGKNSESALISIEKGMTKLVTVVDGLMNAFGGIPTILMSIQAIGLTSIGGMAKNLSEASKNAKAFGINLKSAIAIGGTALSVGYAVKSYVDAGSVGPNATAQDKYRAKMGKSKAGWELGGSIVGGVAGFALGGGPMGAMIGSQAGRMAGGFGANMMGAGVDENMASAMSGIDSINNTALFKGRQVNVSSKAGLAARIRREQAAAQGGGKEARDATKRLGMMMEVVKLNFKEEEIRKMGLGTAKALVEAENERLEKIKEGYQEEYKRYRDYVAAEKSLDQMATSAQKTADAWKSMGNASQTGLGAGMAEMASGKALEAASEKLDALIEKRRQFNELSGESSKTVSEAAWKESGLEGTLEKSGAGEEEINRIRQKAIEGNVKEVESLLKKAGVTDSIAAKQTMMFQKARDLALEAAKVDNTRLVIEQKRAVAGEKVNKATAYYTEQAKATKDQAEMQSMITKYTESTAAGIAASFQERKKEYNLIKEQRKILEEGIGAAQKQAQSMAKEAVSKGADKDLLKAGASKDMINRMFVGDEQQRSSAMKHMNELVRKSGDLELLNNDLLISAESALSKEREMRKEIIGLKTKEVELAVALKEGYLDVINEMTTGSDLVSKLLPDAQRGIVSLHRASMQLGGDDLGGALTRGFVSVNAFADSMNVDQAARYTQKGFKAGSLDHPQGSVMAEYQRRLIGREDEQERRGLQGSVGMNYEKGSIFGNDNKVKNNKMDVESDTTNIHTQAVNVVDASGNKGGGKTISGKAAGGLIPGSPSSIDNRKGVLDGREPINVASGEFIINASQTQKFLPLLQAINGGRGFAGGGLADINLPHLANPEGGKFTRNREMGKLYQFLRSQGITDNATLEYYRDGVSSGKYSSMSELTNSVTSRRHWGNIRKEANPLKLAAANISQLTNMALSGTWGMADHFGLTPGSLTREKGYLGSQRVNRGGKYVGPEIDPAKPSSVDIIHSKDGRSATDKDVFGKWLYKEIWPKDTALEDFGKFNENWNKRDDYTRADLYHQGSAGLHQDMDDVMSDSKRMRQERRTERRQIKEDSKKMAAMDNMAALNANFMRSGFGGAREQYGYATGGLAASGRGGQASMMGGMKIGVLSLNGKVIGQDLSSGMGEDWKMAMQNSDG